MVFHPNIGESILKSAGMYRWANVITRRKITFNHCPQMALILSSYFLEIGSIHFI